MPIKILRIATLAVVLALFGVPLTPAQARSRPDLKSSARNKEKQIHELEKRLSEPYGPDTWFVFAVVTLQPDCSAGTTMRSYGNRRWYRRRQVHVGQRLVFRSHTVQGARAAAEMIWQAQQSLTPLQFHYRGFETEEQANVFRKLMGP